MLGSYGTVQIYYRMLPNRCSEHLESELIDVSDARKNVLNFLEYQNIVGNDGKTPFLLSIRSEML